MDELDSCDNDFTGGYVQKLAQLKNVPLSSLLKSSSTISSSSQPQLDLRSLLISLTKSSCSLIADSRLSRTIQRFDIVHDLFTKCDLEIVEKFAECLFQLQLDKEELFIDPSKTKSWLNREVANNNRIQQYSTFRRACAAYFDSRFSPLFAYLLARIDAFSNLSTLKDAFSKNCQWKTDLWLKVLCQPNLFAINYHEMK